MLSAYDKLNFKEATQIIYYQFADSSKATVLSLLEQMMISSDEPNRHIAPAWYDSYKLSLQSNKESK